MTDGEARSRSFAREIAGSWGASLGMIGVACLVYYLLTKDKQ